MLSKVNPISLVAMVPLLLAPLSAAQGFFIGNNCPWDMAMSQVPPASVGPSTDSTLPAGANVQLLWPAGFGTDYSMSTKLAWTTDELAQPFQFEYSIGDDGNLWWDISVQDGDPFYELQKGVAVSGGDAGSQNCPATYCAPEDESCAFVGRNPDGPTWHCTPDTTITMWIC